MLNVTQDPFVYEFVFNEFQHPLTYRGDKVATIFLTNGFVVWFREYNENFRLLAIPMISGVLQSSWGGYVQAYWQKNGLPHGKYIYPVMKKLPCHWVIDDGYVSKETLMSMFNLDWHIPDYLSAGRQYLASTCTEAYRISQEKVGYPDASTMCGPLTWIITLDANGFPYRIGSWYATAKIFTGANPKSNGQPWGSFDLETFTLMHTDDPMPGYDFATRGNLYPGDLLYSYTSLYHQPNDPHFDQIFLVAGINGHNTRLSITNMIRNAASQDCSIAEVQLYTPGDRKQGVINYEWNDHGFGITGSGGFDIFRWNWITYHLNSQVMQYTVRWGDTVDTIAYDWKISPEEILEANHFGANVQLMPEQIINLPALLVDFESL
jgi:LysM domain-containing protein